MKITVLNGSPKGDLSATMQYVHFIQKKYPQHELKIFPISQQIKRIESNEEVFQEIMDEVGSSDGVLWAFPLYYFLVASQYKRFIELIFERRMEGVFKNRYAAVLTTSIHFFDHTAHNYMHAICDDLDMRFAGSFSAGMYDLLKEENRQRMRLFAEAFFRAIEEGIPTSKVYWPITRGTLTYAPRLIENKVEAGSKKILFMIDLENPQGNLIRMAEHFRKTFSREIEMINLRQVDIKGGCLGCIQCGYDYTCAYTGKDEFIDFFNTKVKTADIVVFAGEIKDRYLSSRWKMFFDRSFFNTHTPYLAGKQIGFIVSGPLSQMPNLRQILEAYTELQRANLVDIVTDEYEDSTVIDGLLEKLATGLVWFAERSYIQPRTFLGVGGTKIFRDDVWGRLRFPFRADHQFYKKHGIYDFPQKDYKGRIVSQILLLLTKIPTMRKEIYQKRMKEEMIKPLQKALEKG
jgi:multimeric flavodoxin WrbA